MALVRPFSALRPRSDSSSGSAQSELAARIAAVPYDVVNVDEARALAVDALSFLHVSRAEIDLPPDTDPYADAVYARAASNFAALKQSSLEQDAPPAIYLYRLRMGAHEQTGVAACFSVDEYQRDLIKKHEKTRPDKENDRTRHIIETRAQSGPVLLTLRRHDALDRAVARGLTSTPLYDVTAPDGIVHTIWRASPDVGAAIVDAFAQVPVLYIADGHHRAASAARAPAAVGAGRTGDAGTSDESAWFLAVAFPEHQMQILPYHRVVKDLAGRTPEQFLAALRETLPATPGEPTARRKGECAMYLAGAWYSLDLEGGPTDRGRPSADPIGTLDVSRLQDRILSPLLHITDPRTDKRIDFVGGIRGTGALQQIVDRGDAAVAFSMFPTTVQELMAIADVGGIMPPKSTWFEPKLRDGLLTHVI